MTRVIIGRKNRLRPDVIQGTDMRIQFYVTNLDNGNRALPGARVRISLIEDETVELVNDKTDSTGSVYFDFRYLKDVPIYVRVRHPDAEGTYEGRTYIGPDGIDLPLLSSNAKTVVSPMRNP